jgi:nucleoside-diphosphate-sugar epimerase
MIGDLPSDARLYIAGHQGMVGAAIHDQAVARGFRPIVRERRELDLTDQAAVRSFMESERPDIVIIAAARVGGIHANNTMPADFIFDNLAIQCNLIEAAFRTGARRLLFLGSSCIYPRETAQPIAEEALLTGRLEPTNEPYAIAKIAGIKLCESYNRQHGTDYRSVMPTNLYGPRDNFHPANSHVLPALLRRFHEAAVEGRDEVVVWGSGKALREFLHVDEMAEASLFVLGLPPESYRGATQPMSSHINVGTGQDVSIGELATLIADVVGYRGRISFDRSKPDGTPRKLLDVGRLAQLGWRSRLSLADGVRQTYQWYLGNAGHLRER